MRGDLVTCTAAAQGTGAAVAAAGARRALPAPRAAAHPPVHPLVPARPLRPPRACPARRGRWILRRSAGAAGGSSAVTAALAPAASTIVTLFFLRFRTARSFGCGAPAEDNVYEDPYAAEGYPWEVEARVWNEFQAKYHNMTAEESDRLISKRQRDIEEQKAEFDSLPKRRRDDDYDGCY